MNSVSQKSREAEVSCDGEAAWVSPSMAGVSLPVVPEDEERWDGLS